MKILFIVISILLIFTIGCSKKRNWENPLDPVNDLAPMVPNNPSPPDGALYVDTATVLCWSCKDANFGDSIKYDIYFDTITPPSVLLSNSLRDTQCAVNSLLHATTYYWKVVALDEHGKVSSGPVWSFYTNLDYHVVGYFDTHGCVENAVVVGNIAYIADYFYDLRCVDITNPSAPIEIGSWYINIQPCYIGVSGNYAFLCAESNGVKIVDISNPSAPYLIGSVGAGDARDVNIAGHYAYIADYADNMIRIVDIINPATPIEVGHCLTAGSARRVVVNNNYAYVAEEGSGFQIINVNDPSAPFVVGSYDTPDEALDVAVSGSYAYISDHSALRIMDITNPSNINEVSNLTGYAGDICLSDNRVYLPYEWWGLMRVIDISDPFHPIMTGYCYIPAPEARSVSVSGNYAYVAGGTAMWIVQLAQ